MYACCGLVREASMFPGSLCRFNRKTVSPGMTAMPESGQVFQTPDPAHIKYARYRMYLQV